MINIGLPARRRKHLVTFEVLIFVLLSTSINISTSKPNTNLQLVLPTDNFALYRFLFLVEHGCNPYENPHRTLFFVQSFLYFLYLFDDNIKILFQLLLPPSHLLQEHHRFTILPLLQNCLQVLIEAIDYIILIEIFLEGCLGIIGDQVTNHDFLFVETVYTVRKPIVLIMIDVCLSQWHQCDLQPVVESLKPMQGICPDPLHEIFNRLILLSSWKIGHQTIKLISYIRSIITQHCKQTRFGRQTNKTDYLCEDCTICCQNSLFWAISYYFADSLHHDPPDLVDSIIAYEDKIVLKIVELIRKNTCEELSNVCGKEHGRCISEDA